MGVQLPPPVVPQQGEITEIQQAGDAVLTLQFQQVRIHLHGATGVPADELEAAVAGADTLSNAVRAIARAYYVAGYPGATVHYALAGEDLHVKVSLAGVSQVVAEAPLAAYFNDLADGQPLTAARLERRRTLASLHADRAGLNAQPLLQPVEDGLELRLDPDPNSPTAMAVRTELGNPGNRFVGRHFLDLDLRAGFGTGDEARASWRKALTGLNDPGDAEDYDEQTVGLSRVTPFGLFGLGGRNVDYTQPDLSVVTETGETLTFAVNGDIQQAELFGFWPLHTDFVQRSTLSAKVDFTHKQLSIGRGGGALTGAKVQDQEYGSAELAAGYARAGVFLGRRLDLEAALAVRSGLGDDRSEDLLTRADLGYLLVRPSLRLRLALATSISSELLLTGQLSEDRLPEQNQWVIGGVGNAQAYLPGVAVGDQGALARLQVDYQLGEFAGVTLRPRVFAEFAMAEYAEPEATFGEPGERQELSDAGVELGLAWGPHLEAAISAAESLSEKGIPEAALNAADANYFFRLTARF
ncbi:MAG TPA: ShlB/FhaC/HecB family hemolysin secretion/activation protein [Nevskiaceae bacterium]|nr:ShlB/FhaC/HecB family hemolysin secretion/activation protein [Nevskiaceae bacterium]